MNQNRRVSCWTAVPAALALATVGCDSNKARPVPPGPPGLPPQAADRDKAADRDRAAQVHAPTSAAGGLPAGHPPVGGAGGAAGGAGGAAAGAAAMPPGHPPTLQPSAPPAAADEGGRLEGALKLSDKVKGKVPANATIFLVARAAVGEGSPGMILAVKKLEPTQWPVPYALSNADLMIPGTKLQGKVVLSARVDQDGDAMTKAVGDLEGATKPIDVPAKGTAKGVDLIFDTVRSQAAGAPLNLGGPMDGAPMGGAGGKPPGHP